MCRAARYSADLIASGGTRLLGTERWRAGLRARWPGLRLGRGRGFWLGGEGLAQRARDRRLNRRRGAPNILAQLIQLGDRDLARDTEFFREFVNA
jgi:hypothetical protein